MEKTTIWQGRSMPTKHAPSPKPGSGLQALQELSNQVKHCVLRVQQKGHAEDDAIAICVASAEKTGYRVPGTMDLTAKGQEAEKRHSSEEGGDGELSAAEKLMGYEKFLGVLRAKRKNPKGAAEKRKQYQAYLDKAVKGRLKKEEILTKEEFSLLSEDVIALMMEEPFTAALLLAKGLGGALAKSKLGGAAIASLKAAGTKATLANTAASHAAQAKGATLVGNAKGYWAGLKAATPVATGPTAAQAKGAALIGKAKAWWAGAKGTKTAHVAATTAKTALWKKAALGAAGVGVLGVIGASADDDDKKKRLTTSRDNTEFAMKQALNEGLWTSIKSLFSKLFGKGDVTVGVDLSGLSGAEQENLAAVARLIPTLDEHEKKALQMELTSKIRGAMLSTFNNLAKSHAEKVVSEYPGAVARGVGHVSSIRPIATGDIRNEMLDIAAAMEGQDVTELEEKRAAFGNRSVRFRNVFEGGQIKKIPFIKVGTKIHAATGKQVSIWRRAHQGHSNALQGHDAPQTSNQAPKAPAGPTIKKLGAGALPNQD